VTLKQGSRADELLQRLVGTVRLEHFELLRPSLHNIFLRIAGQKSE
jgi:ABC-type uncharacterized transport system ATPase subunit